MRYVCQSESPVGSILNFDKAKASEHRHPTSPFELGEYTGSRRDLSDRNRDVLHLEDRGRHRIAEAI